jgi:hypothetical protein
MQKSQLSDKLSVLAYRQNPSFLYQILPVAENCAASLAMEAALSSEEAS